MKVLTAGVYDLMHIGHVKLFEKAKRLGDELIVAIQKDEYVTKYKPSAKLFYALPDRLYMVRSLKYVDRVVEYETVDEIVKTIDFDVFAVGPDQTNEKFQKAFEWCNDNGKQIVVLPRTEGISSTLIRNSRQ